MRRGSVLGVIPARGGSKGIPDKNIRELEGLPLIAYTLRAAAESQHLDRCIVSTDSPRIAAIAREHGGDVPFLRPRELATDSALSVDVVRHALDSIEGESGLQYSHVVLLQPTTPLRAAEDIDAAVEKLKATDCDSVVSVVDVGAHHPARMYWLQDDRMVNVIDEGVAMKPRQELESVYIRNGAVYACKREVIDQKGQMIGEDCRPWIMPLERSINIDTLDEWVLASDYLKRASS